MKFWHFWTDSVNRPAIEAILGTIYVVASLIYAFGFAWTVDKDILKILIGAGLILLGINGTINTLLDLKTTPSSDTGENQTK